MKFKLLTKSLVAFKSINIMILFYLLSVSASYASNRQNQYFLAKTPSPSFNANTAQEEVREIRGKVTDKTGNPIPGVSIHVKGTTKGTTSDMDGNYILSVSENDQFLVFSFLGMGTQEIAITDQRVINVQMEEEHTVLNEIVAVGYGIKQKKDLTGAVSVVEIDDIVNTPIAGVDQMLQGKMAGVNVTGDYAPGGGVSIRVRGFSTIRNNDPLYVIDGVPVESGINMINPSDIESLQVLKDASSSSIYGARAANGVIIITTKKGKDKGLHVSFDSYWGIQQASNQLDLLNAQEYVDLLWEAYANDGKSPQSDLFGSGSTGIIPEYLDANQKVKSDDVDWVDAILQTATVQSYNLNISNGKEDSSHSFSLGYFDQEGIIKYTDFKRVTARYNSQYKLFDRLVIGENLSLSHSWTNATETNSVLGSTLYDAYRYPSFAPIHDVDGNYAGAIIADVKNPLAKLFHHKDNTRKRLKLFGNIFAELEILKDLKIKSNFGIDYSTYKLNNFSPAYQETGATSENTLSKLTTQDSWRFDWTWTNTISYEKSWGAHKLNLLAGMEAIESTYEYFDAFRQDFPYEEENFRYLNAGDASSQLNSGYAIGWSLASYFSKIDYSFDNKYLLAFTFRRDGSSRLGKNDHGNFSAFSLGWRLTEEDFLKNNDLLSNLKLRFGWGQNGNQDVPSYATIETYSTNAYYSNYAIDGAQNSIYSGFTKTRNGNPDLKWETTTQINLGVDMGFLNNRLNASIDYFNKKTKDMLLERPLPLIIGSTSQTVWDNVGEMKNNGIEMQISYESPIVNDFSWSASLNLSHIKNELISLPDDIEFISPSSDLHEVNFDQETSRTQVGQPISSFFGYKSLGIFQNEAEITAHAIQPNASPGDLKFADLDEDGDLDSDDRDFIGNPHPKLTASLNLGFQYKNFDASLFFNGSFGNDVWDLTRYYGDFYNLSAYNKNSRTKDAWSENNTNTTIPRLSLDDLNNNIRPSSYYVSDASYVRLKDVTIGYTFRDLTQKISKLRVYIKASNLITITGYDGLDPEVGLQSYSDDSRNLDIGVDRGLYPPSRTFLLGVNLNF